MVSSDRSEARLAEIDEILEHKPGTREVRDEGNRYTVVGAASRRTFADWLTPVEEHFVCHRNDIPDADADTWDQLVGNVDYPYTFDENVMSLVGYPDGESLVTPDENGNVEIQVVAWVGDDRGTRVEVSTDGCDSWDDADLYGPDYDSVWRLFAYT